MKPQSLSAQTAAPKAKKLKEAPLPEKVVQAQLMCRLRAAGWLVVRVNSGANRGSANNYFRAYIIEGMPQCFQSCGFPDVLALRGAFQRNGTEAVLFEVKTDKGKLSDGQKQFQEFAARSGVRVIVVYGLDGVEEAMREIEAL